MNIVDQVRQHHNVLLITLDGGLRHEEGAEAIHSRLLPGRACDDIRAGAGAGAFCVCRARHRRVPWMSLGWSKPQGEEEGLSKSVVAENTFCFELWLQPGSCVRHSSSGQEGFSPGLREAQGVSERSDRMVGSRVHVDIQGDGDAVLGSLNVMDEPCR
eukprot:CAMPEP_0170142130 /NCGR_PEP_ID=MMETSP0033_2-20121228/7441_1 /TAXON_ID=195969 /ORGANISM="Dolichomastix tenuilepis, Strain CCMP3274" /LENGTH=157 /DNA_ID=CAMNT_0010378437 /DNA_START=372 /DNA_END=845 /DNA_ORIENTATION=-